MADIIFSKANTKIVDITNRFTFTIEGGYWTTGQEYIDISDCSNLQIKTSASVLRLTFWERDKKTFAPNGQSETSYAINGTRTISIPSEAYFMRIKASENPNTDGIFECTAQQCTDFFFTEYNEGYDVPSFQNKPLTTRNGIAVRNREEVNNKRRNSWVVTKSFSTGNKTVTSLSLTLYDCSKLDKYQYDDDNGDGEVEAGGDDENWHGYFVISEKKYDASDTMPFTEEPIMASFQYLPPPVYRNTYVATITDINLIPGKEYYIYIYCGPGSGTAWDCLIYPYDGSNRVSLLVVTFEDFFENGINICTKNDNDNPIWQSAIPYICTGFNDGVPIWKQAITYICKDLDDNNTPQWARSGGIVYPNDILLTRYDGDASSWTTSQEWKGYKICEIGAYETLASITMRTYAPGNNYPIYMLVDNNTNKVLHLGRLNLSTDTSVTTELNYRTNTETSLYISDITDNISGTATYALRHAKASNIIAGAVPKVMAAFTHWGDTIVPEVEADTQIAFNVKVTVLT